MKKTESRSRKKLLYTVSSVAVILVLFIRLVSPTLMGFINKELEEVGGDLKVEEDVVGPSTWKLRIDEDRSYEKVIIKQEQNRLLYQLFWSDVPRTLTEEEHYAIDHPHTIHDLFFTYDKNPKPLEETVFYEDLIEKDQEKRMTYSQGSLLLYLEYPQEEERAEEVKEICEDLGSRLNDKDLGEVIGQIVVLSRKYLVEFYIKETGERVEFYIIKPSDLNILDNLGTSKKADETKEIKEPIYYISFIGSSSDKSLLKIKTTEGVVEDVTPAKRLSSTFQSVMDVSFIDGKKGWIIVKEGSSKGRSTYLYTTKNGGVSWYGTELQEGVPTKGLLSFSDEENGWYVSQEGADLGSTFKELYRTVDGGITWRKYLWEEDILPPGGSIKALNFTSAMVGQLLMFNSGVMGPGFFNEPNLYETFDGGENWYPVNLGLKTPLSIGEGKEVKSQLEMPIYIDEVTGQAVISCRYTWEVGEEKREALVIYRSDDEGITWEQGEPLYYPSPLKTKLQSGFIKDLGIGWALIDYRLFVTYDLGQHWSLITNQLGQYNIIDVGFINQSQTYGVTNRGQVMFSEDGGITWPEQRGDKGKISLDPNENADRDTLSNVKIINKGYVNQVPQYYSNLALEDKVDYKATKYMQIYSQNSVTQHSQRDEVVNNLLYQFTKIRAQGINLRGELYLSSYQGELQGELFLFLYNLPWAYYIKWTVEDINSLNLMEEASPYLTSPLIRGFDGTKELLSPLYPLFSWDGFYFVRKVFIQDWQNLIVEYVDKKERTGTYLAKTTDGGKTWFPMMTFLNPIDGESPIIRSYFKDDIGYVLAEKQFTSGTRLVVYSTKDGGGTWESTLLEANSKAYSAHFAYLSDEEIWILLGRDNATGHQPKELYRTVNGGSSWESIAQTIPGKYTPNGPNGFGYPTGIHFRDTQVGFITALNHGTNDGSAIGDYQFQITKDGGLTWESSSPKAFNNVVRVIGGYGEVYPPVFSQEEPDLGVLLIEYKWMDKDAHKEAYVAMKTGDGGLTWQVGDTVDTSHTFLDEYYINSKGVGCLALGDGRLYKMEEWGLKFTELPKLKLQEYGICSMKIMEDKIFVIERKGGIYSFNYDEGSWEIMTR